MLTKFSLLLNFFWLALAAAQCETMTNTPLGPIFQFKFDPNKPLIYSLDFKTRVVNDVSAGQRTSLTSSSSDTRYKIRLTASGTNQDGTTAVYYEPFDFEQDLQSVGPGGQMDTSVRGLTIISKQNGVVVVDSEKNIGVSQSQNLKPAVYTHLLTGYFDFEPTGRIKKLEGNLPFVDVWQNNLKFSTNIFYIEFPTNSIAVHDSWTNYFKLKTANGVTFNGEGVVQPWVYNRESDQMTTAGQISSFSFSVSDSYKDISGYVDQYGQQTSVAVPRHTDNENAIFQFDQKLGCLVSMKKSDRSHDDMSMIVQGNPSEGHIDTTTDISITLLSP